MKYKKHIVTGALAFSLLIGGSNVFAATPQDLGIKKVQPSYQKQIKNNKNSKGKKQNIVIGTILNVNSTGFTVEIKNLKTKITSSVEVQTNTTTTYSKNGMIATISDLTIGQKVIVLGALDKTTNIIVAKQVKLTTKPIVVHNTKKITQ